MLKCVFTYFYHSQWDTPFPICCQSLVGILYGFFGHSYFLTSIVADTFTAGNYYCWWWWQVSLQIYVFSLACGNNAGVAAATECYTAVTAVNTVAFVEQCCICDTTGQHETGSNKGLATKLKVIVCDAKWVSWLSQGNVQRKGGQSEWPQISPNIRCKTYLGGPGPLYNTFMLFERPKLVVQQPMWF